MSADERGQHLGDGGSVLGGVIGDALQRVDAAEPNVQVLVAELVDRPSEALGDLALLGNLELSAAGLCLPVGEEHAG